MVARGDLGVELPAEQVPAIQKRAVRGCRRAGKPVIVATQMLESMIESPVPTRAEASDVATAIYDGADAVMLSAESATGKHPQAAVAMMSRIIEGTEADPQYRQLIDASHSPPCRASRTRPRPCAARCATPPRCSRRPRSSASPVPAPPACARRANGRRRRCSASRPAWRRAAADAGVGRAFRACGRRGRHRAVHPPGLRRGDGSASAAPDRRWRSSPACLSARPAPPICCASPPLEKSNINMARAAIPRPAKETRWA